MDRHENDLPQRSKKGQFPPSFGRASLRPHQQRQTQRRKPGGAPHLVAAMLPLTCTVAAPQRNATIIGTTASIIGSGRGR
jgi:hypothetical protein